MGVDQRTGEGSKPRIPRVVSKSDRDHGTATTDNRNLGLTPAVTISRSNLSLGLYPIHTHPNADPRRAFCRVLMKTLSDVRRRVPLVVGCHYQRSLIAASLSRDCQRLSCVLVT